LQLGQKAAAVERYREALRVKPDWPVPAIRLRQVLSGQAPGAANAPVGPTRAAESGGSKQ